MYTLTTDITGLRDAEQRMADLALSDTLTNLANRRNFELQLPQALDRAARTCTATALIYLDVDHFKSINDRYGHAAGDAVLTAFAQRLSDCVRRTDLVARLSGDEFVVLAEGLADIQECHLIAQKINANARRPIAYQRHRLTISTSIGIAFLSSGEKLDSSAFVALADAALYRTKGSGRDGYTVATPADTASELSTTSFAEL